MSRTSIFFLILLISFLILVQCNNEDLLLTLERASLPVLGLKSADVTKSNEVQLVFTHDIMPSSAESINNFVVTTENGEDTIAVVSSRLDDENAAKVFLTTEVLEAGETYRITIYNIKSLETLQVPPEGLSAIFLGVTSLIDSTPPNYVSPPDGTFYKSPYVVLQWTARLGAVNYTVEIASDDEFIQPIEGSPFTTSSTELYLELSEDITYYWRVRADVTAEGEYSMIGDDYASFVLLLDAVYVYCPPEAQTCSDFGRDGNRNNPMRSISGALQKAQQFGINTVKVANRGDNKSYIDVIELRNNISLHGGYDSTFEEANRDLVNNRSKISAYNSVVYGSTGIIGENINTPIIVEGFELFVPSADNNFGIKLSNCNAELVFRNNTVELDDSNPDHSYGLYCNHSNLLMSDSIITTYDSSGENYGIYIIEKSTVELTDNLITANFSPEKLYGIYVKDAYVEMIGNTIHTEICEGCTNYTVYVTGEGIALPDNTLVFNNNTLTAGGTSDQNYSYGLYVGSMKTVAITNNTIQAGRSDGYTYGVKLGSRYEDLLFSNNTVMVENESPEMYGLESLTQDSPVEISNNLIITKFTGTSATEIVGMQIKQTEEECTILNNVVLSTGADNSLGIKMQTFTIPILQNNTIAAGNADVNAYALLGEYNFGPTLNNNILFTLNGSGNRYGIYEAETSQDTYDIEHMTNNLIFDAPNGLFADKEWPGPVYDYINDDGDGILSNGFSEEFDNQIDPALTTSSGNITLATGDTINDVFASGYDAADPTTWVILGNGLADLDNSGGWSNGDIGADTANVGNPN